MKREVLWSIELGLDLQGACVGPVGDEAWLFACARDLSGSAGYLIALDACGRERWRVTHDDPEATYTIGVQPHLVQCGASAQLIYGHSCVSATSREATRHVTSVDRLDGSTNWAWTSPGPHGLNRDVLALPDGRILAGPHDCLVCLDPSSGSELWRYDSGVRICWGSSALLAGRAGSRPSIVLGTEWGNTDGTSSLIALTTNGQELWRSDGVPGDLGSTGTSAMDVDGDGSLEIVHVELDLEGRVGLDRSRLWLFDAEGTALAALPFGGAEVAIADWDGDGHVEAVGATVRRDGGRANAPEIVCLDLTAREAKWRMELPRWWLAGWPQLADLDGDGVAEAVVSVGNPNGYGRVPGEAPWGDLHVLRPDGTILDRISREGAWSLCQLAFPHSGRFGLACLWGDGRVELLAWD